MLQKILFSTNIQKILFFLIRDPGQEYFDRQISKLTGISKAGTNFALRDLAKAGLVAREKKGRMYFYRTLSGSSVIKYLKITQNIISLHPLTEKLKGYSLRVVLYGSAAKGENHSGSDIDLFIMSREPEEINGILFKSCLREKVKSVTLTPNGYMKWKQKDPVFYNEVEKGIVLWEQK